MSTDRPEGRTVSAPEGWRLVLPAGWATIPVTDAASRDRAVKRLLDHQFTGTARDELITVRIDLERRLRADLAKAASAGATQVHVLADPVDGLPISAMLMVAQLYVGGPQGLDARLAELLGEASGVAENGMVDIGSVSALRRRRRIPTEVTDDEVGSSVEIWTTHVDYVVQVDAERLIVLGFTTQTDPLADQLVDLFDAIAQTLHVEGDGELAWGWRPGEDESSPRQP